MVLSWSGGRDFAILTDYDTFLHRVLFLLSKPRNVMVQVPCNKLLINLASSNRAGKYWHSVIFVRTERREVRTNHIVSFRRPQKKEMKYHKAFNIWYILYSNGHIKGRNY